MSEVLTPEVMGERPLEVPQIVANHLAEQAVILEKNDIKPHPTNGREVFNFRGNHIDADIDSDEYDPQREKQEDEGYTEGVEIRRDPESGEVVYAKINGHHPRSVTRKSGMGIFLADRWDARIHLPSTVPEDGNRRLVLDTWTTPTSKLGRIDANNPTGLSGDVLEEYNELYSLMLTQMDEHGIQLGAIKYRHRVYPGSRRQPEDRSHESLPGLMERVDQSVTRHIGYIARINEAIQSERA